ncbi:hypothetical protein [Marinifilum fragile]|uniref:hypothetical protein n=1 Tax=Marinifilum fragile TaxID=570161 RepID=UPI002AA8405E|nr:hypothetical protein [Marinifilum fragile]
MYCSKCGGEINENDFYCSNCGKKIENNNKLLVESDSLKENTIETFAKCIKCNKEKRNIYKDGKFTGNTICLDCEGIKGRCPLCGKNLRTENAQQCRYCNNSWHIKTPTKKFAKVNIQRKESNEDSNIVKCPICASQSLTANKKGFGVGKAVVGGLLLGGVGLLGGFVGSRKIKITCLNCGHSWKP